MWFKWSRGQFTWKLSKKQRNKIKTDRKRSKQKEKNEKKITTNLKNIKKLNNTEKFIKNFKIKHETLKCCKLKKTVNFKSGRLSAMRISSMNTQNQLNQIYKLKKRKSNRSIDLYSPDGLFIKKNWNWQLWPKFWYRKNCRGEKRENLTNRWRFDCTDWVDLITWHRHCRFDKQQCMLKSPILYLE